MIKNKFAVLGNPIAHSLSPVIHEQFSKQKNFKITYKKILVEKDLFAKKIIELNKAGFCGLNITLPFKEEAYEYALSHKKFSISTRAKIAKSVNTFYFENSKSFFADNTDGIGFINSLLELGLKKNQLKKFSILILGSGGASKGIISPLLDLNSKKIYIANRTPEKLKKIQKQFKEQNLFFLDLSSLKNLKKLPNKKNLEKLKFDLIINATSSSVTGQSKLIDPVFFRDCRLAVDLFYSNKPTPFMQYAKDSGAQEVADGLGMLIGQAAESFFIWTGFRPETSSVFNLIRRKIKNKGF